MACDCCSSVFAVAAFSSTKAEFCCVTSSIWVSARLTWSMPDACSALAEAISDTIAATCLIESTISVSDLPARLTSSTPSCTCPELLVIRSLMSFAACEERCARLRTSDATTAKPRPASPARAASTAALSASRLVCRAISSITLMMSEILRDDSSIRAIALTACAHRTAAIGHLAGAAGELIGLLGVLGVLFHGRRDLLHRGRGLFQARGLLLGALGEVGGAGGNLHRGAGDLAGGGGDRADGVLQLRARAVEIVLDLLIGGGEALIQAHGFRSPSESLFRPTARARTTAACSAAALACASVFLRRSSSVRLRCCALSCSRRIFSTAASRNTSTARAICPISSPRSAPCTSTSL